MEGNSSSDAKYFVSTSASAEFPFAFESLQDQARQHEATQAHVDPSYHSTEHFQSQYASQPSTQDASGQASHLRSPNQHEMSAWAHPSQHQMIPPAPVPPTYRMPSYGPGYSQMPGQLYAQFPGMGGYPLPQLSSQHELNSPESIRKKNSKIDIPEGRNLSNIDTLIKDASTKKNVSLVNELKVQKRLLRNREAALHSRQKKKDSAERLERDNKDLLDQNEDLRREVAALRHEVQALRQAKQHLETSCRGLQKQSQESQRRATQLTQEKMNWQKESNEMRFVAQQAQLPSPPAFSSEEWSLPSQPDAPIATGWESFAPFDTNNYELPKGDHQTDSGSANANAHHHFPASSTHISGLDTLGLEALGSLLMLGAFWSSQPTSDPAKLKVSDYLRVCATTVVSAMFSHASMSPTGLIARLLLRQPLRYQIEDRARNVLAEMSTTQSAMEVQTMVDLADQHSQSIGN